MGKDTGIAWCDHTFNPWRGCTKVSAGCKNCYAETLSKRNPGVLGRWGDDGTRVVASESMWREPLKWDHAAAAAGERRRVFCASLADVFEDWRGPVVNPSGDRLFSYIDVNASAIDGSVGATLDDARGRLFNVIQRTPNLDWLLLTKRPENVVRMVARVRDTVEGVPRSLASLWPLPNVWLGVSAENQIRAEERLPVLIATPARVRFVSYEPAIGPVDWRRGVYNHPAVTGGYVPFGTTLEGIDWIIVGGESGPGARPFDVAWAEWTVAQCKAAGVACFMKQLGAHPFSTIRDANNPGYRGSMEWTYRDPKGGDPSEWPESLRVREFPTPRPVPSLSL